jgi:DNA polymerase III alpha subunit
MALASVWSGPSVESAPQDWRGDPAVSALVTRLSERRVPLAEAQSAIADYAKSLGSDRKAKLTLLMAGLFDRLNSERGDVIAGLDRYGHKQKDMAERVRTEIEALNSAQSETNPDQQKVADLASRVQWDTRLFEDRRRALTYVCEAPALIEQRLGALARTIAAAMD